MPRGTPNKRFMEIVEDAYRPRTDKWKVSVGYDDGSGVIEEKFSWTSHIPYTNFRRGDYIAINSRSGPAMECAVNRVTLTNDNAKIVIAYHSVALRPLADIRVGFILDETMIGGGEEDADE